MLYWRRLKSQKHTDLLAGSMSTAPYICIHIYNTGQMTGDVKSDHWFGAAYFDQGRWLIDINFDTHKQVDSMQGA